MGATQSLWGGRRQARCRASEHAPRLELRRTLAVALLGAAVVLDACAGSRAGHGAAPDAGSVDSSAPAAAHGGIALDAGTASAPATLAADASQRPDDPANTAIHSAPTSDAGAQQSVPGTSSQPSAADEDPDAGDESAPTPHCQPSAAGPYAVLEGEAVTLSITCQTGLTMPQGLTLEPLPPGAAFDAATATLTWTPALDQAAHYQLTLHASPWNETGSVEIFVVDRWDAPDNLPVQDPATYLEEYGLPVLHMTTDPGLNDDDYTPATIVYRGHTYIGAQAKLRGATSSKYPKRSYTLKFTKEDKFSEPAFAGGFNKKRKVTLITSFDDNSYLRQRLGFELWNRLDPAHIQVQTYSAVLFLNGEYYGLYTVSDHVDGYLMEDFGLDQDGDLYKARNGDANFRDTLEETVDENGKPAPKVTLHDGFTKEEGLPAEGSAGAYDDLDDFMTWVETSSTSAFAQQIDSKLRRKEYEDWWIFVSFIRADDSAAKNSYHYRDPTLAGSLWRFIPWDLNESFGQDWSTLRISAQGSAPEDYYLEKNHLFERMLAEPTIATPLRARYANELDGPFAVDQVLARLDDMVHEVDLSARRDEQKWLAAYRGFGFWSSRSDFTTYEQEVQYLRKWIADRHAFLAKLY